MSTLRPNEYVGEIAIDHETAGVSIEDLIKEAAIGKIPEGYYFAGIKFRTSHLRSLIGSSELSIDAIFKDKSGEQLIKIDGIILKTVDLFNAITEISIKIGVKEIDWNKLL